ncbi:MAG: hypothetical protein ACLP0J_23705 [Solirubrobacteraceae bacterium]
MTYLTMYDSVNVGAIPANAEYVALYVDGPFANLGPGRARCPHAKILTITVIPANTADCCDCEQGDITIGQAEAWVQQRLAADIYRPCVYANADRWDNQGLQAGLAAYGNRIRRWTASYPGAGPTVPDGYDAHQWSSTDVDLSVCVPDFFGAPAVTPSGIASAHLDFNLATGELILTPLPGHDIRWGSVARFASQEIQLGEGGDVAGEWRQHSLPFDAPPLGGP